MKKSVPKSYEKRFHLVGVLCFIAIVVVIPIFFFRLVMNLSDTGRSQPPTVQSVPPLVTKTPTIMQYPASNGQILWRGDFSTGDTSQWAGVHTGGKWGNSAIDIVRAPGRPSIYAARFTVKAAASGNVRAELTSTQQQTGGYSGQEWYYSWSTYIPAYPNRQTGWGDWNDIMQWMDLRHNCSPPLQVDVEPAQDNKPVRLVFSNEINAQVSGNCSNSVSKDYDLVPLFYDHWFDFTVHVKWSEDARIGFSEVWVNGCHVLPLTHMQTLDPGSGGVYMEQELYRPATNGTNILYHAGTRRHTAYTP